MSSEYEIREPITSEEIDAVAMLYMTTFRDIATHIDEELDRWFKLDEWKKDSLKRLDGYASDELTIAAFYEGKVVGAVTGFRRRGSDRLFDLEIMAVEPTQRRNRIGTRIVNSLVHTCTNNRIKAIHFNTAELVEQGGAVAFWDAVDAIAPVIKIGTAIYEDGVRDQNGVYYKIQLRGNTW